MFYAEHGTSAKLRRIQALLKMIVIVCFKIFLQCIWTIFDKIILTPERRTIDIRKVKIFKITLIERLSFSLAKIDRNKNTEINNGKC